MPKITFITPDDEQVVVEESGGTLMEAAVAHGVKGIDADCGGVCSCATCHVYVDPAWVDRVGAASETEKDTLEFVDQCRENSRLSCQVELTEALDGLVVRVAPHD